MTTIVLTGCDRVVTTVPVGVVSVVLVICVVVVTGAGVVTTAEVAKGAGGGGPETTCDWGSDTHPAMSPTTLEIARSGASGIARFAFLGAGEIMCIHGADCGSACWYYSK